MNRILYVARKAKGLTEQKMATFLEVDETTYKEMELCLADISAAQGVKLGKLFDLPPDYFLANEEMASQRRLKVIQQATELVSQKEFAEVPPGTHILIAKLGMQAILTIQELNTVMLQLRETTMENEAIRKMYKLNK
jgi:transcriptional regulator with XRE-family HTH domain